MSILPQSMLFLGVIPSLILLFISLKGYEEIYKDKTVFLTFIAGLVIGIISILIEYISLKVGIFFIILFPLVEQILKTVVLNIGRFQRKKETVIYGLSIGLGFGSIFTPYFILISSKQPSSNLSSLLLVFLGSLGIIFLHGATGVSIGYGVYKSKLPKYFIFAVLLYLPITISVYVTTLYQMEYLQLATIPYGLVVYWYMTTKIMSKITKKREKGKK